MKPALVVFGETNNLTTPKVAEFFDIYDYDATSTYDRSSTIFVTNYNKYKENQDLVNNLINNDYKLVFENLTESNPIAEKYLNCCNALFMFSALRTKLIQPNVVQIPLYFWYKESREWSGEMADYTTLNRELAFNKKFLMLMSKPKKFRLEIYDKFIDILPDALYSFVGQNIRLPGDVEQDQNYWDRYINVDWYNQTQFSVVVETFMDIGPGDIFITEKSMKPLALHHPFLSLSCPGTLNMLRQAGFETFENIFNESYDNNLSYYNRIDLVYNQIKNYNSNSYDYITKGKIAHNFNWFFNKDVVDTRYKQQVIDPLLEFVNE